MSIRDIRLASLDQTVSLLLLVVVWYLVGYRNNVVVLFIE